MWGHLHSLQQKASHCLSSSQEVNTTLPGCVTQKWIQGQKRVEGTFACKLVTHSCPVPSCRTASSPLSSWAFQLDHVPSGAVTAICNKDGWNLMPRLSLNDNYFLDLCQGQIIYFFLRAADFEPREISFPLYPRAGCYQPSCSKSRVFSLHDMQHVGLKKALSFHPTWYSLGNTDLGP